MRPLPFVFGTAVFVALCAPAAPAFAQHTNAPAHGAGTTTHPAAAHPAHATAGHGTAGHASAAPASTASASPAPTTCADGETMQHGHCCPTGADWAAPQRRCMAHNRRQALVQVVVSNPHGALPSDLAITLDGTAVAGTPPSTTVAPGAHALQVTANGYRTVQQQLTLAAGDAQRIELPLEATSGRVVVNVATDGAEVKMDGQALTGTPPSADNVAPGSHHIRAVAPGHDAVERDVTVTAGETASVDIGALPMTVVAVASPSPPPPPPPPTQVVTVVVTRPGDRYDIEITTQSRHFHCEGGITSDHPCTIPDVPPGSAHVHVTGHVEFSSDVTVPEGASTLRIDYTPTPGIRIAYGVLGVLSLVPAAIAFVAAGTCSGASGCDALPWAGIGLLVVPGILPGGFFLASAFREQGHGSVDIAASSSEPPPASVAPMDTTSPAPSASPSPAPTSQREVRGRRGMTLGADLLQPNVAGFGFAF